jgi:hypothetical protein
VPRSKKPIRAIPLLTLRAFMACKTGETYLPEGKNQCGDPDVDGRIILRRIFMEWDVGVCTGLSCLRIETGGGHL